jgi:hypothetical protein
MKLISKGILFSIIGIVSNCDIIEVKMFNRIYIFLPIPFDYLLNIGLWKFIEKKISYIYLQLFSEYLATATFQNNLHVLMFCCFHFVLAQFSMYSRNSCCDVILWSFPRCHAFKRPDLTANCICYESGHISLFSLTTRQWGSAIPNGHLRYLL